MSKTPIIHDAATEFESIVAVFDSKVMALRAVDELRAAKFDDVWIGIVRGENDAGKTVVAGDDGEVRPLQRVLVERGTHDALARRFEGILPPCTAVMSLRTASKGDQAMRIIEVTGGHIEDV